MMAKGASNCLFFSLLFLLFICSSGTLVGFSYHAEGKAAAYLTAKAISCLQQNKVSPTQIRVFAAEDRTVLSTLSNSGVSVDLHLNDSFVENLRSSNFTAISWLKTQLLALLPHVGIKSIVVSRINSDFHGRTDQLVKVLSTLKSVHSILSSFNLQKQVKASVAFSSSFLKEMKGKRDLLRVFGFIKKTGSSVIVEAIVDGEMESDWFVQSVIKEAGLATLTLPCNSVPIVLTMKLRTHSVLSVTEVAEFTAKVEKSLENNTDITTLVAALYVEVSAVDDLAEGDNEDQIFVSSRRELISSVKRTAHDVLFPIPPSTTLVSFPPNNNPTPTIGTVPFTNPVTITTPTNPTETPGPIPTTTPVTVPSTNPINPTVPITNPVTTPALITVPGAQPVTNTPAPITVPGAQPVTNPVTTYPAPTGGVPVSTPVTNPVSPPATTNAPAIPGQSWCVAKTGASETSLQAGLDYACGMGGDCSQIQQGANCYNPNTLQNHASYAFNSYYQKNPAPTSCDFGGTATIVNTNPSSGSCMYPSSASQLTPTPTSTSTPTATPATSGAGIPGSITPASVLNSSTPGSSYPIFGPDTPPSVNTSTTSMSSVLQPFIGCFFLLISFVAGVIILDVEN